MEESRHECLQETLQALQEDIWLLYLALMGAEGSVGRLTMDCLFRLADYLDQHITEICTLCEG